MKVQLSSDHQNSLVRKSTNYLQEQLNLVLEDSASEDEPIISSEEEDVTDEGDSKMVKKILRRRSRCESPDFHGFESWTEEAEYVKSLEGFRR